MERVKGIEPSYSAWKAAALPLSYTRIALIIGEKAAFANSPRKQIERLVEEAGFEPAYA